MKALHAQKVGRGFRYQCYKTRINVQNERKYVFFSKKEISEQPIRLSRLECLTMVESKLCNNNKMSCNEDDCFFKPKIVDEDILFVDQSTDYFECSFHKKRIIAEKADSQLFFSTSSNCQYKDLYCTIFDSIVVLESNTQNQCQLTKIHYGEGFLLSVDKYDDKWRQRTLSIQTKTI